jgi:hypothetical protein
MVAGQIWEAVLKIELTREEVLKYSKIYEDDGDDDLGDQLRKAADRGFMSMEDLIAVAKWKWQGGAVKKLVSENTKREVREISEVSFNAKAERLRVGALMALRGVGWPMASVILHFSFPNKYPILDVRAMKTVGSSNSYTFDKWIEYTRLCRKKSVEFRVTMRVLDRALWAFDKVNGDIQNN